MKNFTKPEVERFPIVIRDEVTAGGLEGYINPDSNLLDEDKFPAED